MAKKVKKVFGPIESLPDFGKKPKKVKTPKIKVKKPKKVSMK